MKIAIDTFAVTAKPGTTGSGGGKTFLTGVVKHLAQIDKDNQYYLYLSKANQNYFDKFIGPNFTKIVFPFDSDNKYLKFFFEQFIIPIYNLKLEIDVLFCPTNLAPLVPFTNVVLAVQSMHYIFAPKSMSKLRKIYHRILLPQSVKRAKKVIAVSESIRNSIVNVVGINSSKIEVVYEGADLDIFNQTKVEKKVIYNYIPEDFPYILFVSTLYKFKNADKLIKAFALAKRNRKVSHKLVIVGRDPNFAMEQLRKVAFDNGVQDDVILTGPVEIDTLINFYHNADLLVYPSSVETFGLPPLEAMACGTPVIGSNRTSVPEVIGDAGIIVDPNDINALADAIVRVLSNQNLQKSLIAKGYERIKQFSWDKTARKILNLIEKVYGEKKHKRKQSN